MGGRLEMRTPTGWRLLEGRWEEEDARRSKRVKVCDDDAGSEARSVGPWVSEPEVE